ncbi:MAG: class I SAM-dependent DNA methyltransferase [Prevotella sp.]|nr:class I SAM-dependent DNA methyltransferase [Prevotella sp.]
MHYTSIENIHKVIDPLFLNDLRSELDEILEEKEERQRVKKLDAYQDKLSSLTFLDPACGSGNFLTETYLSLRRLENEVIRERNHGQTMMGEFIDAVKVNINQFYGIEINDFAVTVATTALWISEAQMLAETERIIHHDIDFLPLKSYTNIHEGNALRIDWETVVPKDRLNYIIGNPPFVGYAYQTKEQKDDLLEVCSECGSNIDYVAGWYYKAARMINGTNVRAALVSTNSITQGEQVSAIWKNLIEQYGIQIDFAHRTFRWDSEASLKAHVHCVIVGFSNSFSNNKYPKRIFDSGKSNFVGNINPYLIDAPNVFIVNRKKPISRVPEMIKGSSPVDGGNLIVEAEDYEAFILQEPLAIKYIHRFVGAREFLHDLPRYCLWLQGVSPKEINSMPLVRERIAKTREFRLSSSKAATRKFADMPTRFMEIRQPYSDYIIVPRVSSETRRYIPMGYMDKDVICSDSNILIPEITRYHFGILESNVHMAWMRVVCGRLKSDYRYSNTIVYNNFPWPNPTEVQKAKIEQTAQTILDARALYPDSSLADLYDELTMPVELRKAHQDNDRAVMQAYGFDVKTMTESQCVAELFKLYQQIVTKNNAI